MKTLFLLAVLLPLAFYCPGQSDNPKKVPAYVYGLLAGPDITTGVLHDRCFVLALPAYFNGISDSLAQYYAWHQLYK